MKKIPMPTRNGALALTTIAFSGALAFGLVGCAAPAETNSASNANSSSSAQVQSSSSQQTAQSSAQSNAQTIADVKITQDEALNTALDHAKFKQNEVQLIQNEFEIDDGLAKYEIDFIGPDNLEYEYEIDGTNGEIIAFESEPRD